MRAVNIPCKLCKTSHQIRTVVTLGDEFTEIKVIGNCGVCGFKPEGGKHKHTTFAKKDWIILEGGYKGFYVHPQEPTWGYHIVEELFNKEEE